MERGRELQAGIKAEETIQLPPRDTKKSEKLQQQIDEDVKHGRELREKHGQEDEDAQQPGERHRDRIREKVRNRAENEESDGGGQRSDDA